MDDKQVRLSCLIARSPSGSLMSPFPLDFGRGATTPTQAARPKRYALWAAQIPVLQVETESDGDAAATLCTHACMHACTQARRTEKEKADFRASVAAANAQQPGSSAACAVDLTDSPVKGGAVSVPAHALRPVKQVGGMHAEARACTGMVA
jgi:hypothetical protein